MAIYKVYKVTNSLNGKIYVGQTKQAIEKRFIQHLHADSPLGQAMRQCGAENFTIEVIEECKTQEKANERERFWIKVLNCKVPNGYNLRNGASGGGNRILKPVIIFEKNALGKTIYTLRTNHNMTQKELGNIASISEKTVSAWEKERIIPRMGAIQRMADFFGIKKSDIIEPISVILTLTPNVLLKTKIS